MLQQEPGLELATGTLTCCSAFWVAPKDPKPKSVFAVKSGLPGKLFMESLQSKEDYFIQRDCAGAAVLEFVAPPLLPSNKKPPRTC